MTSHQRRVRFTSFLRGRVAPDNVSPLHCRVRKHGVLDSPHTNVAGVNYEDETKCGDTNEDPLEYQLPRVNQAAPK